MITLYNEKDQKIKLISVYEVLEADMGESSISATVSFSEVQDFHPDWYVIYNGEKFRLGVRKPTGKKDTSSLSTTYTLVFKSEREDLKRYTFMDFVELGSGNPQPNSYNVPLYATLSQFVDRFNTNLNYYMQGWKMVLPDDYIEEGNAVSISFDNATLWDVLLQVYETFGVRWTIDGKIIKVAFPTVELEYVFEYGKGNGLVSVERNNALERIITRLRGRGGEKNLPPDYFHTGDPDTNSFLQATYFKNLMPKSYRDYIRGYNAGSGTGSWAYNKGVQDKVNGVAITPVDYTISDKEDIWGISYGAIEPAEGIFPTLQGATRNGVRLDEVLYVEPVLSDGPRGPIASTPINIGSGGHEDSIGICGKTASNWYTKDCRDGISFTLSSEKFSINNPANKVQIRFNATPSITNKNGLSEPTVYGNDSTVHISAILELIDTTSEASGEVIRTYTVEDMDTFLWELEDVPVSNQYRFRVKVTWSADILKEDTDEQGKPILVSGSGVVVNISTYLTGAMIYEYERPDDKYEFKETFDIEIRDVWGISRDEGESDADYTYRVWEPRAVTEEMTVMFSDGLLAGEDYEFRIVGFSSDSDNLYQVITSAIKPTDAGGWRLTLQKSDAETEASGRYLPNTMQNAKAGDYFFFVNIAMPYDPYVYDAEERVLDYLDTQLALKDEEFPSFTITPSKIFCKDFAELSKLRVGSKVRVSNAALIGDTDISLHIQSITKRYTAESFNPEWNITISDQIVASGTPVSLLEGSVAVLNQKVYSNNKAVKEAIKSMSSTFLRRDGVAADSNSITEFKKRIKLGREGISDAGFINGDINGKGFGVYTDDYGNRVVEADVLVGRIGARFNEVEINQVTYSAGKQIFSSAGMVVNRVEDKDSAWRCYFDTENGAKRNYFAINDGAFSQRFTDAGIRQYWQRVVAMGANYIDITKGGVEPLVGDNIAQLGNSTDKSRQAALIIDETKDSGGLVTWYDDITDFTLSDKDSVNIGRIDGKTWLKVYGSAYIGDRNENQYIKYEDGILKVSGVLEVGSQISDALTVVEEGLVQTSRLMLGYMESDTVFRIMSGTNGIYDETEKGGGIAAWYGGPMADKEADNTLLDYAQSIIRFDGSGYFAGGNISWDKSGAGSMAGGNFSWDASGRIYLKSNIVIGDDEQETLGGILGTLSQILDWFELRTLAGGEKVLYTKHNLASEKAISWRGVSTSGGGGTGGGLIQRVYGYDNITNVFDNSVKTDTFNAYTIAKIAERVSDIEKNGVGGDVDLTGYATEDWVLSKDYATNTAVAALQLSHNTLRSEFDALNNVLNDDVSGKINTWNEVVDFLDEYSGSQDLATILAGINGDISTLQGKFTKDNIQTTLGIADWALAASKPSYDFSEILNKPTTLAGYGITDALSTSGGRITGNLTFVGNKYIAIKPHSATESGGGWAVNGIQFVNSDETLLGGLSAFGNNKSLSYLYLGVNDYAGLNLRIGSSSIKWGENNILHEGNYSSYALPLSGGAINGDLTIGENLASTTTQYYLRMWKEEGGQRHRAMLHVNAEGTHLSYYNTTTGAFTKLVLGASTHQLVTGSTIYDIIHSGNIGEQSVNYATSAGDAGTLGGQTGKWYQNNILGFKLAGSYDANAEFFGLIHNYNSVPYWVNAPTGMSYGRIMNFNYTSASVLIGQLAWDINHGSTTDTTRNLWWRAISTPADVNYAQWHQIAFTDSNVASASKLVTDSTTAVPNTVYANVGGNNVVFGYETAKVGFDTYLAGRNITLRIFEGETNKGGIVINNSANVTIGASDLASTATKLYVDGGIRFAPRTIWGQSFDGSGDVSGEMQGVRRLRYNVNNNYGIYLYGPDFNSALTSTDVAIYGTKTVITGGNVLIGTTEDYGYKLTTNKGEIHCGGISIGTGHYDNWYNTFIRTVYEQVSPSSLNGAMVFYTMNQTHLDGTEVERMRITSSGNLLIGTSVNDGYKLAVNGDVKSNGFVSSTIDIEKDNQTGEINRASGKLYLQFSNSNHLILCQGGGNVGIGTATPAYKLDVNGTVSFGNSSSCDVLLRRANGNSYITATSSLMFSVNGSASNYALGIDTSKNATFYGNISATGSVSWGAASDRRLKDNIKTISSEDAINVIMALNPVTFKWNNLATEKDNSLKGLSCGFIADEYTKVIPNSSRPIWEEYDAIDYKLTEPYVVKGLQNHEERLRVLERENRELKNELNKLRGYGN